MKEKLRWGIIGCAGIAEGAVIPGLRLTERNEVAAIASRNAEKAKATADKHGIAAAYGSYEALLEDSSIDAVYIPLPNHLHKEWTIRAAQAGKHILCEKPMALNAAEAEEMAEASEVAGVRLTEAFMYRYHPRYDMIRDVIASGEIGDLRGIHGTFTFNASSAVGNVRFRKAWGGGSVYDIGCYPISAARLILGREPEAATAHALFSAEHDDVDMMASGLLEFPDAVALTFECAMWAGGRNTLQILGADGYIDVPEAFLYGGGRGANFRVVAGGNSREVEVPQANQYALQADDFAAVVLDGKPQKFPPSDAVANMRVIDAVLQSARERKRVVL